MEIGSITYLNWYF